MEGGRLLWSEEGDYSDQLASQFLPPQGFRPAGEIPGSRPSSSRLYELGKYAQLQYAVSIPEEEVILSFFVPFFVQELHELIQLHHEVQLLRFKLNISQLADEKLLPLLETLDPSDRCHKIET